MLHTGNDYSFGYHFEAFPFRSGFSHSQKTTPRSNPLVDQYLYSFNKTTSDGSIEVTKLTETQYGQKYTNYEPGPWQRMQGFSSSKNNNQPNMPADDGAIDYRINDDRSYSRTGPDGMTNHHNKADKIVLGNSPIMQSTGKAPTAHWTCTDETAASPYAAMSTRKMLFSQNNATNKPTKKVPLYVGVQPGQVWMDKRPHVGRDPDTDGHFHPTPTWGDLEAVAHHQ